MVWARFDDGYLENPKVEAAGLLAEHLDMRAIIYCARNQTDGLVTERALQRIGLGMSRIPERVRALERSGRWVENEAGGWVIHDFLEFNPSKAQTEAARVSNRVRQEVYRTRGLADQIKKRDGAECRYCGTEVNWKDRRGKSGAVFEHVVPVTQGGDTTLDNLVVACRGCNEKKGGRTPEQAGMTLNEPRSDLDEKSRSVGSGRDGSSFSISRSPKIVSRCKRCDRLSLDCECPPLAIVEGA